MLNVSEIMQHSLHFRAFRLIVVIAIRIHFHGIGKLNKICLYYNFTDSFIFYYTFFSYNALTIKIL